MVKGHKKRKTLGEVIRVKRFLSVCEETNIEYTAGESGLTTKMIKISEIREDYNGLNYL